MRVSAVHHVKTMVGTYYDEISNALGNDRIGDTDEINDTSLSITEGTDNGGNDGLSASSSLADICRTALSTLQIPALEGRNKPSLAKAVSSLVTQVLRTTETSSLERLTRAAGETAAAKAMAPQERTEKTVEKRILTETLKEGRGIGRP